MKQKDEERKQKREEKSENVVIAQKLNLKEKIREAKERRNAQLVAKQKE